VGRLVNTGITVLVTGESGTGKELLARALHYNGDRRDDPFIPVNCTGLQENLLDNELFGHESEAFTGAESRKKGKFEAAGEGTIFLDEIGDISPAIQSKLLRVLQEKEFQRLGGTATIRMKARIIAATNRNLTEEVEQGRFREDLYYRLNAANVHIPPLRERKEDIPLLLQHFIGTASSNLNKTITGISEKGVQTMIEYEWPGNVRELENVVTNICINLRGNFIDVVNITNYGELSGEKDIIDEFVDRFLREHDGEENIFPLMIEGLEKRMIERLGEKLNNNKSAMARILGISRVTVQKKIKEL